MPRPKGGIDSANTRHQVRSQQMNVKRQLGSLVAAAALLSAAPAEATEWFVAAGASGTGTSSAPFGRIQDALNVAQPGDTITVGPGTYSEALRTMRGGVMGQTIRLRTSGPRGSAVVTTGAATVLRVTHPFVEVEGLVIDGQFGLFDTVLVSSAAESFTLRNVEVRRSTKDLIDMAGPINVLIDNCLIHSALNAAGGRTDAHGIAAGPARNLTIRATEIHTFSGDGFQIDPGRSAPGWTGVTIERSRIWLAPLPAPTNGFAAGVVPGENAVDTKTNPAYGRATITIRDTIASGFRNGLITNMAAFNLKENIEATLDGITVYDSEIAFRNRGPGVNGGARVTVKNAVVYNTLTAFRYEDNIELLNVWNSTIGANVTRAFQAASSSSTGLNVRNLLVLGALPSVATDPSNRAVGAESFVNAAVHNYMPAPGSPAIDAGAAIPQVTADRAGTARPQGKAYDIGAYETAASTPTSPAGGDAVIHAAHAVSVQGAWQFVDDATAASGRRLWHPDQGLRYAAVPTPVHYFEVTAWVEAGKPYRVWLRGKAQNNLNVNDAASLQFSSSVDRGAPAYRIGTYHAIRIGIEACAGCGLADWGWQTTLWTPTMLGPTVTFAQSGLETIRVLTYEDGLSIDQIVLSPSTYLTNAPGAPKQDATILPVQ
jgi:hypothetical protein